MVVVPQRTSPTIYTSGSTRSGAAHTRHRQRHRSRQRGRSGRASPPHRPRGGSPALPRLQEPILPLCCVCFPPKPLTWGWQRTGGEAEERLERIEQQCEAEQRRGGCERTRAVEHAGRRVLRQRHHGHRRRRHQHTGHAHRPVHQCTASTPGQPEVRRPSPRVGSCTTSLRKKLCGVVPLAPTPPAAGISGRR